MLVLGKFAISLLGSGRSHQAAWGRSRAFDAVGQPGNPSGLDGPKTWQALVQPGGCGSVFLGVSRDQRALSLRAECQLDDSGPDVTPCRINLV
jgi:hypothetical protein